MNIGIDLDGMGDLQRLVASQPQLAERNLRRAMVDTALMARPILREATRGPKSGQVAQVAELWQVIEMQDGAAVVNPAPIAGYLEYGTGIYNKAPGAIKKPIVPRNGKFLRWIGPDGKPVFRRSVRGFKGIAMIRTNLPTFKALAIRNGKQAAIATAEGRSYA